MHRRSREYWFASFEIGLTNELFNNIQQHSTLRHRDVIDGWALFG